MPPEAKRRRKLEDSPSVQAAVKFSSTSKPPYNLLSNFYGDAELHFMAARFEHASLKNLLTYEFASCSLPQFRVYFQHLHPSGKPYTYIRAAPDGTQVAARGILGRLAGIAAVSSSSMARKRMKVLCSLAGLEDGEKVATNTASILEQAGLDENAGQREREMAIGLFNDQLMWQCLERKFRKGHCSEDGVEFRALLLGTGNRRIREVTGRGGRWAARGEKDGVLGEMLVRLRKEIRSEAGDGQPASDTAMNEEGFEEARYTRT